MKAEILSIGTELLLGQIVDTNANFLAQQLPALGLDLYYVSQIGDNQPRLADAFRRGLERSDVIITSGGLGPTEDALTREALAEGMGEALGELTHSTNPTLATYAKSDGIHLRITAKAAERTEAERQLDEFEPTVRERVAEWVYGGDSDSFPAVVGTLLRQHRLTLAVAESATGGELASLITEAPGASDYFLAGYVAYSAAAKQALGVSPEVLAEHGTV